MTLFGAIADDFTGATDLAGLLARSGLPVSLRIGVPDTEPGDAAPFEVIALKCRTAPVAEAVADCRAALSWLQQAGARHFFWKYCSTFDSTPNGNIGPVAEALMEELGAEQTIYCPAFPENGRSIFMGNLFVGQQPLSESPMKDHPLTPMRDSNLMRLLAPQVRGSVGLVDRLTVARGSDAVRAALGALKADDVKHVIMDAVADADLEVIARACREMKLLTGGSAVAMPLPQIYLETGDLDVGLAKGAHSTTAACGVVLSGSCSAMTRSQVAFYAQKAPSYKLDPRRLAQDGATAALDWLEAQALETMPLVYATADPKEVGLIQAELGVEQAGALVEAALARLAVAARDRGGERFVVAGGETSGAVTQALGVSRLQIGPEIAPGVPWTFCQSAGRNIALTLKSGNFGNPQFFSNAVDVLEAQ